jgi:molybdate transport system regulatory protein
VNSEVGLTLKGGGDVVSIIANSSADSLGLKEGKAAYAIIKASSVMISKDSPVKLSARNALGGTIASVQDGAVDSEVTLKLSGGSNRVAIITRRASSPWGLRRVRRPPPSSKPPVSSWASTTRGTDKPPRTVRGSESG